MRSSAFAITSLLGVAQACSTVSGVKTTFYGYPDNSPPGPATAYSCGSRGSVAGGTGTYSDPLTFASALGEYNKCEIVYSSYLKKYLRQDDSCEECTSDWASGTKHIDIWTGSSTSSGGNNQIDCEDALTPDAGQQILRSPPSDLPVDTTALYSSGTCHTSHTYDGNTASCSGGSSGCQTGCSWAGHCIGCACETYDDCSDDYICTNGLCANP